MSSIKIEGTLAGKIGFASHQNAVPVLRELQVVNDGALDYRDLVLELVASPPFLAPKSWRFDHLAKGATLHVSDRDVKLDATYLSGLGESLTGDITLRLVCAGETLAQRSYPVELLAQNEWGGSNSMPELLAAFSMPNDPAVDRVLKAASEVLRRAGKNASIDGYTDQSRTRTWEITSALWSAVCGFKLSYALPPASFETQGQKIRTPGTILEGGVATCLDTALLFAAALEQAGLNALIVITQGHAFAGVWLQPQEFSQLITDEASAVRKRIDLKELLVFETTMATSSPAPSFSAAVADATRQVNDEDFILALDMHRARMQRIRPLALASTLPAGSGEDAVSVAESLEEAPVLPGFDVEIAPEADTPAGKLILWQRKLLDLTTRNRLLHLPEGAKAIRLVCPEPAALEDRLADGKRIRIVAMPDLEAGGRDAALYEQQNRENLRDAYARTALSRGEVVATLEKVKLEAALVDMYRKSRSDLDEGGANTLFLAMGFLQWKKTPDDPKSYSAPLILLPVKLERKSALSGVTLSILEDEPRFNLTLLELLRHDFELVIPGLDGELPGDENGIDVEGIWNIVRRAVRDVPGFEVTSELVLGTFSFAKYLMWKDLADRSEQLMQSPLVKHLLGRGEAGGEGFVSTGEFPLPEELDQKVDVSKLFTPLPADSSQLAAVVASANGCDFVLDGPPGTGKSQTIANMIAHNLALGRRVLFVAEKMAALDVVNRRLEEKGLGEFCLELHSSKTSKVEVLKQLERAWDTRDTLTAEQWATEAAEVQRLRDKLNGVVAILHKRWPNGLSAHQAIGRVVRDANETTPRLSWPEGTQHDVATLAQLRDVARRLDLNRQAAQSLSAAFGLVTRSDWSNGWQASLVTAAHDVPPAIDALEAARAQVLAATRLPLPAATVEQWLVLGNLLLDAHGMDLAFAFAPDMKAKVAAAHRAIELLATYKQVEQSLSLRYAPEASRRLPIEQFENDWTIASGKFWFFATWAKKKVSRALAAQGGATGLPDTAGDLPKLKQLRALLTELDGLNASLTGMPGWAALASDTAQTAAALELAEHLRPSLSALASSPEHLVELRRATAALVVEANDLLGKDGSIATALHRLKTANDSYVAMSVRFMELATGDTALPADVQALRAAAIAVTGQATQLKAWCDWCRVRDEAIALGLKPVVDAAVAQAIAEGSAADVFETAYARWFAAGVIDAEPLLRNFVPAEHMSDIESYRQLDDRLSKLSVRYIRAKLCGLIPSKNEIGKQGGFGILKHELQKSRRHKPLRQLAAEMGDAMGKLAPCMLMSPLSIAQYLPPDQALFDLVIFDEASQIAPWDAIGSIARGKQVVIAGDPRQMPPTSFFARGPNASEDDTEEDMESILDECLGAGVPSHSLSWHYRSRHESLIAFSNHRYYDSKLITFPAAETRASAVEWRRVQGVYAKGKGRYNQLEAEAMVAETVRRLLDPAFTNAGRSIGIITLNTDQQKLVTDLLDRARQQYPEIEPWFQEDQREPVVVKNLETVQGDERDLIMLGIGYGPTEAGSNSMSMNFGPLNKEGGWRRLNVAVTRARREMLVFSSFDPSMVDLNRTSARAVRDLKHFIEFAQRGPRALAEAVQGSVGSYDSPFEEAVAKGLRDKGWQVVPQIGVSRFRIDLGIVHPDRPGDYLVGIECDGAAYHSAATARDRDKVRSGVLLGLGWKLLRLWSTEWWVDRAGALERLHAGIEALLVVSRAEAAVPAPAVVAAPVIDFAGVTGEALAVDEEAGEDALADTAAPAAADGVDASTTTRGTTVLHDAAAPAPQTAADAGPGASADGAGSPGTAVAPRLAKSAAGYLAPVQGTYRITDFAELSTRIDAERFYQADYDETLGALIERVLTQEAPILDAVLVQRIARAHGFARSGRLIRERVLDLATRRHHVRQDPLDGHFVWRGAQDVAAWTGYRVPANDEAVRTIEEVPFEELRMAVRSVQSGDRATEAARLLGVRRLSITAQSRLEAAGRDMD